MPDDANAVNLTTAEHEVEQQTIIRFLTYFVTGTLPPPDQPSDDRVDVVDPLTNTIAPNGMGDAIFTDYLDTGFPAWDAEFPDYTPLQMIFNHLGSLEYPDNMVNLEGPINLMKARVSNSRITVKSLCSNSTEPEHRTKR